ncbi:uncharacterized protein LOC111829303 [Capsella rubella]|uniref:uncharacterized protein LOC111829303 n=1 Tax=Capsella rubella TaxID=81985 RepID=UPI000CD4B4B0|nr:uncharacterized protein LOC111829303 [Capsella rubella]
MELEQGTNVGLGVATLVLVLIVLFRMQRSRSSPSQPKYKKGLTMMGAILLLVHVILCIKEFEQQLFFDYNNIYRLGMMVMQRFAPLLFGVLFILVVVRACWGGRKHKSGIVIAIAVIMLAFVALFARESIPKYSRVRADTSPRGRYPPYAKAFATAGDSRILTRYKNRVDTSTRDQLVPYVNALARDVVENLRVHGGR